MARESTILNEAYHNYLREVKGSTVPPHALPTFKLSTKNPERQIKQKIQKYLKWIGYECAIIDSAAHYSKDAGMYIKSETTVGTSDLIACIDGRYVAIEVKRIYDTGRDRQSEHQKKFQKRVEGAGGLYMIVSDFMNFYNKLNTIKK